MRNLNTLKYRMKISKMIIIFRVKITFDMVPDEEDLGDEEDDPTFEPSVNISFV